VFCAFFTLLMLCGGVGIVAWLLLQRVTDHMRVSPEAAKLIAEHVITPLLAGGEKPEPEDKPQLKEPETEEEPKPKRIKGPLI
jgi:hypothetical protein